MKQNCCLLASKQSAVLFDIGLLYVQSCTPYDGRKDSPKHVECHYKINKCYTLEHLVGFIIGISTQIFFYKYSKVKSHENPCSASVVVQCGQTDGQKDRRKDGYDEPLFTVLRTGLNGQKS